MPGPLDLRMLQYFRPSLSYHLSLGSLFCLFLSGCFTQVLLYMLIVLNPICTGNLQMILWPTVKTKMKCGKIQHFIRFCPVCQDIN